MARVDALRADDREYSRRQTQNPAHYIPPIAGAIVFLQPKSRKPAMPGVSRCRLCANCEARQRIAQK